MSRLNRTPAEPASQGPPADLAAAHEFVPPAAEVMTPAGAPVGSARRVPRTRAGSAWVGVGAATLVAVALIVFLAQNTGSTEISFLWMSTTTPLAVALLIAAVGSVLLTLIIGTARIAQLRRLVRKLRD